MVPDIVELRKDLGFVEDLARFSENILSEKQVRAKYHLFDESAWVALGVDEAFVEAVELERTRRVRSGATKRELAQLRVVKAPEVLGKILEDERANSRHRIDAAKALDDLAGFAPQRDVIDQERVIIRIDLSADTKDPADILTFEASARPNPDPNGAKVIDSWDAPRQMEFSQPEPEVRRGRGRPPGSKNKPKATPERESSPKRISGFDV